MSDISERLALQPENIGGPSRMDMLRERIEAKSEIDSLRARVAELEAERTDDDALRERMADILKRTAVALRGPEPPLTAWSWHDLPERAAAAKDATP